MNHSDSAGLAKTTVTASRLGIRWQQLEWPALKRRNGPKMPLVETEQTSGFVALRKNRDRAVGETEAKIGVAAVEFGDRLVIAGFQACDVIAPRGEIAEEGASSRDPVCRCRRQPNQCKSTKPVLGTSAGYSQPATCRYLLS